MRIRGKKFLKVYYENTIALPMQLAKPLRNFLGKIVSFTIFPEQKILFSYSFINQTKAKQLSNEI